MSLHLRVISMPTVVEQQELRSQQLADGLRKFLGVIHTGGITALLATAGALAGHGVNPGWTMWPLLWFAIGITLVGVSMLTGQHRALRRSDVAQANSQYTEIQHPEEYIIGKVAELKFPVLRQSLPYNIASLLAFLVGAISAVLALSCVVVSGTN